MHEKPVVRTGKTTPDTSAHSDVPRSEMKSFQEIISYTNLKIIERYQTELGLSVEEAKTLLKDVVTFLYLGVTNRSLELTPTPAIDDGWHEFLMFTKEYQTFCKEHFGFFIHHQPFTLADKANKRGAPLKVVIALAKTILDGNLSKNWNVINGDAVGSCDEGGDCSAGDCSGDCSPIHE